MEKSIRKALLVDCCIRREKSRTAKLLKAFAEGLPADMIQERLVLDEEPLSCFTGPYFQQRERLLQSGQLDHHRFHYAHQFADADIVCIAAPFWDLSFPALLKIYIEQISVDGITFSSGHGGLKGLCKGSDLIFLTTRGGIYTGDEMEMGSRYLDAMHHFFGFDRYTCIAADGLDMSSTDVSAVLAEAEEKARSLAASL